MPREMTHTPPRDNQGQPLVLIIDDEKEFAGTLRRFLDRRGLRAEPFTDPWAALRMAALIKPDVILLDLVLGRQASGGDVGLAEYLLELLKADHKTKSIPVVGISGKTRSTHLEDTLLSRLKAKGADSLFNKGTLFDPAGPFVKRLSTLLQAQVDAPTVCDILHVEDDDEWAGLLGLLAKQRGLTVKRVARRAEANGYLSRCVAMPRCIVLDLGLPDGAGLQLCDELKASPRLQGVPVIVVSASPTSPGDCYQHRALHHVAKDAFAADRLGAVLDTVLAQHDWSRGVIEAGELKLDPHRQTVTRDGHPELKLERSHFAAFALLVKSWGKVVPEEDLYEAFLTRRSYKTQDRELTLRKTLRDYVYQLRRALGADLGSRIVFSRKQDPATGRETSGFVYQPPER